MGLSTYAECFLWITKRIDQVSDFLKRKNRRDDIHKTENALNNNDANVLNDGLSNLKERAKVRDDSR